MSRLSQSSEFMKLLKELSGKDEISDFAGVCSLNYTNAHSYLSGKKEPGNKVIKKVIQNLFGWPVIALSEVDKIPDLNKLPEKPGVYILYDSAGNVLYIGKATNFKIEIRQALSKKIPVPIRIGEKLKKSRPKIKDLAFYYSAYEIQNEKMRHNFEAIFLRVLPNQTHNSNTGKFK